MNQEPNEPIDVDQLIHDTKWTMKLAKERKRPVRLYRAKPNHAGDVAARSVDAPNTINDELIEKGFY